MAKAKPRGKPFQKGQVANPAGRPVGSRNKINQDFLEALTESFEAGGREALERCRTEHPETYIKVVASLLPKEVKIESLLHGKSEDELRRAIGQLDALIAAQGIPAGAGEPRLTDTAVSLQTVQ